MAARNIRRIAILPADLTEPEGTRLSSSPALVLNNHLYSAMSALPHWQIISERQVREIAQTASRDAGAVGARRLGELVDADAVLSVRILRYREREGGDLGAKSPASVAFVLDLWDVKRGDVIWSGHFDETQKALSENIFAIGDFTHRGVRWLKVEELTLEGVKKAVRELHQILYRQTT